MMKETGAPEAWRDFTVPLEEVMDRAMRWLPLMAAFTLLPHVLLWGLPDGPSWGALLPFLREAILLLAIVLLVYIVSAALHEGLHVLAMLLFAGVPVRTIRFGLRLREGVAFVHTSRPMTVRAYRAVLVTPGLVQGVVPAALGLALGEGWLTIYGFVMLASAVGDLVMLRLMHPLAPDILVRDHPDELGCQVFAG